MRKPLGVREQVAEHALKIRKDIIVPVADNSDALLGKPLRSAIVGFLCLFGVLRAVHFDGQSKRCAIKIDDERPDRMLLSER